jgi:hypothetical protein
MDTKQTERAIILGLETLGWATRLRLANLDDVHDKVDVVLARLLKRGWVVRAKVGIAKDDGGNPFVVGIADARTKNVFLLGTYCNNGRRMGPICYGGKKAAAARLMRPV